MSTFIFMIILFTMFGDETAWGEGKGTHMCTSSEKHLWHPVSLLGKTMLIIELIIRGRVNERIKKLVKHLCEAISQEVFYTFYISTTSFMILKIPYIFRKKLQGNYYNNYREKKFTISAAKNIGFEYFYIYTKSLLLHIAYLGRIWWKLQTHYFFWKCFFWHVHIQ